VIAVVPAAGLSTRMGRPKLALPLGDRTILEHVVTALRASAYQVVVVVGPRVPELVPLAKASGAQVCLLTEQTPDMRATVERGLQWVEDHFRPRPTDAWLLAPADHPTLEPSVVRELCDSYRHDPTRSILIPVFGGRRGHPTLVAWRHVEGIRALAPDRGINAYFREHASEVREVEVTSAGVLCDLDTPEDYARLCAEWKGRTEIG
jgi:molybdenum cofactor cytidylyltransferase